MVLTLTNGKRLLLETKEYLTRGGEKAFFKRMRINGVGVTATQVVPFIKDADIKKFNAFLCEPQEVKKVEIVSPFGDGNTTKYDLHKFGSELKASAVKNKIPYMVHKTVSGESISFFGVKGSAFFGYVFN